MKYLEMKIPPVALVAIFMALMWLVDLLLKGRWSLPHSYLTLSWLLVIVSMLVCTLGVYQFRVHQTTVNPMNPESASRLVQSGIYRFTRNPMYLGFALFLLATALYIGSAINLVLVAMFVLYMTAFQIKPEEKALLGLFGEEYEQYRKQVRRWI